MAKLKLLELRCNESEDVGKDEAYLTVDGKKVWATPGISSGETVSLRAVAAVSFSKKTEVALWDQDTGMFDSDDNLGKFAVMASLAGQDEQEYRFTKEGADYLLIYKVLPD